MEKQCSECGAVLRGRSDKKFCSDLCRNNYNNKLNSDVSNYVRRVNSILRRNRRILQELKEQNMLHPNRSKLLALGFDFNYFTSMHSDNKGRISYFCYELGYTQWKEGYSVLSKKGDYLDK